MNKKIPLRLCVGCKEMKAEKGNDPRDQKRGRKEIFLDATGKKERPGGVYMSNRWNAWKKRFPITGWSAH